MKGSARVTKRPNLEKPRRAMEAGTRRAAREMGRITREEIRRQVPPPQVGLWPGTQATGALKDAIVAQEPTSLRKGQGWRVAVGIQRTRKAAVYARIHDVGGVIKPRKQGGVLRFVINGEVIFARRVRIRRKRWFSRGWAAAMERLRAEMPGILRREVRLR